MKECELCGEMNDDDFECRYVRQWKATGIRPPMIDIRGRNGKEQEKQETSTGGARQGTKNSEGTRDSDAETEE